jgi:hypothetical protein
MFRTAILLDRTAMGEFMTYICVTLVGLVDAFIGATEVFLRRAGHEGSPIRLRRPQPLECRRQGF